MARCGGGTRRAAADPYSAMLPRILAWFPVSLCALWLASASAHAQPAQPEPDPSTVTVTAGDARQGTFKTVQGDVTLAREASRHAVVPGDPVFAGDRILTGERSTAALTLRDGSVLSIGPGSQFVLSQFEFEATTREGNMLLTLVQGSLRVVTGLIARQQPEQVQVRTPTTVIGVRGTDFIVEQAP